LVEVVVQIQEGGVMAGRLRRLRIERICLDFQRPDHLIEEDVIKYVDRMRHRAKIDPNRAKIDPVLVYYDGKDYRLFNGFHRVEAALRLGRKTILAEIIPGTLADMKAEERRFLAAFKRKLHAKAKARKKGT
jgi:hypothetical protein